MTQKNLFAALAAATLALGLASCGSDDNVTPEPTVVKAKFTLDPTTNADFNSICDMNVAYKVTDGNGKTQSGTETLTAAKEWTDVVCPCTFTVTYTFTPKTASIVENQKYTVEFGPYVYTKTDADALSYGAKRNTTLYGSLTDAYLEKLASREREVTITVNEQGKIATNNNGDEYDDMDDFVIPTIDYGGDDSNNNDKTAQ